jgi:hypothetical protein
MTQWKQKVIAAVAACVTTLALFSAVASLADSDRAAKLAAHIKPMELAAKSSGEARR